MERGAASYLSTELAKREKPYPERARAVDPEEFTRTLFKANELTPTVDSELANLVADASVHFEDADVSRFLKAHKRFDFPVIIRDSAGEPKMTEHFRLKESFKELPACIEAAKSTRLTYEQAVEILVFTLDSDEFSCANIDQSIRSLTRFFNTAHRLNIKLAEQVEACKDIIKFGGEKFLMDASLYASSVSLRLGLSVEQAYSIIATTDNVESPALGYVMPHFYGALKSMLPARVNPELVVELFDFIAENNGFYSGLYDYFKNLMTFGGPSHGMSANELLALFLSRAKNGKKELLLLGAGGNEEHVERPMNMPKEKYFIENENEVLEHAALPYRKIRPLNEGVKDLEKLAIAKSRRWEEVGEGFWTYDSETTTWYSLGGQLDTSSPDAVRHTFSPYDLSHLSENPYLFHVHPEDRELSVAPPTESLVYPELRDDITKFLTATPSGEDYGTVGELLKESEKSVPTRSFITHALGVTEFTYPHDPVKLEEMKAQSRNLRDQALLEFDIRAYVEEHGLPVNRLDLVGKMIEALNRKLPEGFALKLHPTGTDFTGESSM